MQEKMLFGEKLDYIKQDDLREKIIPYLIGKAMLLEGYMDKTPEYILDEAVKNTETPLLEHSIREINFNYIFEEKTVNESIKEAGKILIDKADMVSSDLKGVLGIEIKVDINPAAIAELSINKKYGVFFS
jgi:hypothetical protein